jgi:hypothetical protein
MPITYNPTFQHDDWVDNVDRVQAGGPGGFNIRFHQLEDELAAVSGVVGQIDAALTALGQTPPAQTRAHSLTPQMVAITATGWEHGLGFAQKPAGATSAGGMMSVALPHNARLQSLRATGRNEASGGGAAAGSLRIILRRQDVNPTSTTSEIVARVDVAGNPFDLTAAADTQFAVVDNSRFRYFLSAQLSGAQATDTIMLFSFVIIYTT